MLWRVKGCTGEVGNPPQGGHPLNPSMPVGNPPTELEPALLQAELEDMCQDEYPGHWEDLLEDPDWVS